MSPQSMTSAGKIAVGMAIAAALLSITATVISYVRLGQVNIIPMFGGLIVSLLVIFLVRFGKKQ